MNTNKWHMHRLGLIDFWYYVNEEFLFKDGHMLLRGSNGSGKSVTMQSFIPLLLDGNRSSERLDAFGTRSRKLENYLLEEDGEREDRIGYLYLEFKQAEINRYKTIGMGLHARKNKPMDVWYFVIEDNRRINHDIQLMDQNLAITKTMLKNIIHDQLITSQKAYMEKVNQSLFGFSNNEEYKEALQLLMQLRSPKLSNSLKPTMINDILSNSLQPLSEDDLRPMSEAISSMDDIEDQLAALKQSLTSAKAIEQVYTQYNHAVLQQKAMRYLEAQSKVQAEHTKEKNIQNKQKQTEATMISLQETNQRLNTEKDVLNEEKRSIANADLIQLKEEVDQIKQNLINKEHSLQNKQKQMEEKNDAWIETEHQIKQQTNQMDLHLTEVKEAMQELDDLQHMLEFIEHDAFKEEIMAQLHQEYGYTYIQTQIKKEMEQLKQGHHYFETIHEHQIRLEHYKEEKERILMEQEQQETLWDTETNHLYKAIDQTKEAFYAWNQNNRMLKLSNAQMYEITDDLQAYAQKDSFVSITNRIHKQYQTVLERNVQEAEQCKIAMQNMKTKEQELTSELHKWETMEDPKPNIDEKVENNRIFLTTSNIPYIPFYTLLEFHETISSTIKDQIEELLLRMGLLNALVVEERYKNQILHQENNAGYDTYLFTSKPLNALTSFEIRWKEADQFQFTQMLQFFQIKNQNAYIKDKYYQNGILTGTISHREPARFIGKKTREAFRKLKISEYQNALMQVQKEYQVLTEENMRLEQEKKLLQQEMEQCPKQDAMACIKDTLRQTELKLTEKRKRFTTVETSIQTVSSAMAETLTLIHALAQTLHIQSTQQAFTTQYDNFEDYKNTLTQFIQAQRDYASMHRLITSTKFHQETIQQDLDAIRYDLQHLQTDCEKDKALISSKEKQLKEFGYEDVMKRLDEIQQRLTDIDDEVSNNIRKIGAMEDAIQHYKGNLVEITAAIEILDTEKTKHWNHYLQEIHLSYVIPETIAKDQVKEVLQFIQNENRIKKRKDLLESDLHTSFHSHRGNLQEYNITILSLFQEEAEQARLDINARYKGKKVKFSELVQHLQEDIDQQKLLLEESDRILIEDILVNTISKKIRNHIQSSQQWVNDMNKFMSSMDTSSGLKLKLQWKSRKAENEEELNSEKLVALLMKDLRLLNDADKKRLSTHFRSKIQSAREKAQKEDSFLSFHTAMKEVMDYRNWFDFKILYEKPGEKRKEMTNNAFYAFSGGEKAMSMYIPLFSAVAAKFESADPKAPLIIALDEAFAGVDEKNIQNMFALIRNFHFDYIMNSQVLWGDYPTVPSLAIYELFRPENAKYVTVISYEWDGHKKRIVNQ
ncbi:MAG: TIGR02680 family protein [Erysipelotrichaceae bacterium]|nr:TIGR02680 family protein [Erysipelotrichaceae bacterium]